MDICSPYKSSCLPVKEFVVLNPIENTLIRVKFLLFNGLPILDTTSKYELSGLPRHLVLTLGPREHDGRREWLAWRLR